MDSYNLLIYDYLINELSSSDESEDETFHKILLNSSSDSDTETSLINKLKSDKKEGVQQKNKIRHKIQDFVTEVVSRYTDIDFKNNFRLRRSTVEMLCVQYSSTFSQSLHGGTNLISYKDQILITLWYLSNKEPFRTISGRFSVSESSVFRVVIRVISWLNSLKSFYIKWPTDSDIDSIVNGFKSKKGVPGVLGAIYVPILKPINNQEDYVNRKGFHSILMQTIVDHKRKILHVTCGYPGSMHDARMLRKSDIFEAVETRGMEYFFPKETFLLGDSAQRDFNYKHSSTRMLVEQFYGHLKGRFRRDIEKISQVILACCVLHNIIIVEEGDDDDYLNDQENIEVEEFDGEALDIPFPQDRRQRLFQTMYNYN